MEEFMKKLFVLLAFAGMFFGLMSCKMASTDDDTTYKVEGGVISQATYNTAINKIASWGEATYLNIAALRSYLYNNTESDYQVKTSVSLSEIRDLLLSKGMSNYEVEKEIDGIKKIGNEIVFFTHATDSSKRVWMYVTK